MSSRKRDVWSYSLWFISDDYENNAEFVNAETRVRYLREAKKLLKSQSKFGKAAVIVDIAWKLEGKVPKAIGAEFLHNDQVKSSRLHAYIDRRLRQIGLEEGGLPLGLRSKAARGRAIDDAERAFSKKPPTVQKTARKKKAPRAPTTVTSVLDRIKAKKSGAPCNPHFANRLQTAFTPGVMMLVSGTAASQAVQRFARCDWGDVSLQEARRNNRLTITRGDGTIRGIYHGRDGREFWIDFDPRSQQALLLLPEEN